MQRRWVEVTQIECLGEGNLYGLDECGIDISDLVALVNHLFVTFEPLPPCPGACRGQ
ncbi:MAG: hypothetical protein V3T31_12930 [candidate division Zixibacteria bacterium]